MNSKSFIVRTALACTAAAVAIAAVSPAMAQSAPPPGQGYDQDGHYYFDSCGRDQNSRALGGGLIGLAAGAAAGSNLAGRHNRDEGTVLGGILGALIGANVGKSTAACTPQYRPEPPRPVVRYRTRTYYDTPYYAPPPPPPPPPAYYDNRPADDGCQMVESRVRMPDGRTQTRLVKTCPDRHG